MRPNPSKNLSDSDKVEILSMWNAKQYRRRQFFTLTSTSLPGSISIQIIYLFYCFILQFKFLNMTQLGPWMYLEISYFFVGL